MRIITIVIGLTALPALAAAQTDEGEEEEANVVFVDHSEVEIVVEEEGTGTTPFVEQEDQTAEQTATQPAPPPPQGQVNLTVPPPPQVQLDPEVQRRQLLRARLSEHSLGGPIAMLAVGFPLALIFSYAAYVAYRTEDFVCGVGEICSDEPNRTATAILGTIAGAGLVLGVAGLITLIVRVSKRAQIRREVNQGTFGELDGALIRF